jgi:hypothetical protein
VARTVGGGAEQVGCCRVRAVEKAEDVELDHSLPLRQRSVRRWTEEHHAGIVDECIETAELLQFLTADARLPLQYRSMLR